MIIKSMSRKTASFGQLTEYMSDIDKSDDQYNVYQNIFSHNIEDIEKEFYQNSRFMAQRKNGNYMYHEVLSISKSDKLNDKQQKEMLRDIAYQYAQKRAKHNLVFGTLHDDHDNQLHYHFIISANGAGEPKRTRLSKAEFSKFKKDLELMVLKDYPELNQKQLISKQKTQSDSKANTSNKEQEYKRRTKKLSQKDIFKQRLTDIFNQSADKQSFFEHLAKAKIEIYTRGKTIGFVDLETGRKHRLKTLGLEDEFAKVNNTISQVDKKEQQSKTDLGSKEEWIKGDFSKRDINSRKEKWKVQAKKDNQVKSKKQQSTAENIKEKAKEWLFGDFTARDARTRQQQSEERIEQYKQQKSDDDLVKDKSSRSKSETLKETSKEWLQGDFSERDARIRKESVKAKKIEQRKAEMEKAKIKRQQSKKSTRKGRKQ